MSWFSVGHHYALTKQDINFDLEQSDRNIFSEFPDVVLLKCEVSEPSRTPFSWARFSCVSGFCMSGMGHEVPYNRQIILFNNADGLSVWTTPLGGELSISQIGFIERSSVYDLGEEGSIDDFLKCVRSVEVINIMDTPSIFKYEITLK